MKEDECLEQALANSRVAPDYTMGALAQQTGIPPDTLRSWERRYGFPEPFRTETNRRLYSERDITAIGWLREQTERGQGISEAISMLRSRLSGNANISPKQVTAQPALAPTPALDTLVEHLKDGHLEAAQESWDELALTLSPGAIGITILKLHHLLRPDDIVRPSFQSARAHAFLLRKATLLLDHAGPDHGRKSIGIITGNGRDHTLPATILGAALAHADLQVITPFPDMTSLTAIEVVNSTKPDHVVLVGATLDETTHFSSLLPGVDILRWNTIGPGTGAKQLQGVVKRIAGES